MHPKNASPEWILQLVPGYVSWINSALEYRGANPRLLQALGLSSSEIVGKPLGFREGLNKDAFAAQVRLFFRDNLTSAAFAAEVLLPAGKFWHLVEAQRIPNSDEAIFVGIDITEERRLRSALESEREERAQETRLASLGELAASIAHEIRSPLAAISGNAEMLELSANEPERVLHFARKILQTSERMSKIAGSLQTFARRSDRDPFQSSAILPLIKEAQELLQGKIRSIGADIEIFVEPENLKCECRPHQISQVLVNLLRNSLEAIQNHAKPWVRIEAKINSAQKLEISVIDSGSGIPPELAEKINQPFFTSKPVGEGTGLGLRIIRRLLQDHKGSLELDSTRANTCFHVTLPLVQPLRKAS